MKFVPIEKMSKRRRKEACLKNRGSWEGVVPVTRVMPNGKGYNRRRMKRELLRDA